MNFFSKGNPSEIAMFKFMESTYKNVLEFRARHLKVFELPFNSSHKFQLSIYRTTDMDEDERLLVVMTGAPEVLVERSRTILIENKIEPLDDEWREKINKACKTLAKSGERVIAMCDLRLSKRKYPPDYNFHLKKSGKPNVPLNKMRFLGLMSIIDPPRPGVSEAVEKCKMAGIRVVMITGDHSLTAKAIAKSVGIITSDTIEDIAENFSVNLGLIDRESLKAAVITGQFFSYFRFYKCPNIHFKEMYY